MGAGSGKVASHWFHSMYESVADTLSFTALAVVTSDPASVESLLSWAAQLQDRVSYVVVLNHVWSWDFLEDQTENGGRFRILTLIDEYIGSGEPYTVEEWVAACSSLLQIQWKDHIRQVDGFRPEYSLLVSDPATIRSLGWKPTVDFATLARMMVESALKTA